MIFVGSFTEKEIKSGKDKIEVEKAKNKHNLNYVNTKYNKKKNTLDIWVCDVNEFTLDI